MSGLRMVRLNGRMVRSPVVGRGAQVLAWWREEWRVKRLSLATNSVPRDGQTVAEVGVDDDDG
jgi:hypothetical protein